jgi:hypothetical protein
MFYFIERQHSQNEVFFVIFTLDSIRRIQQREPENDLRVSLPMVFMRDYALFRVLELGNPSN